MMESILALIAGLIAGLTGGAFIASKRRAEEKKRESLAKRLPSLESEPFTPFVRETRAAPAATHAPPSAPPPTPPTAPRFDALPLPLWWRDTHGTITSRNTAYDALVGEETATGGSIPELYKQARALADATRRTSILKTEQRHLVFNGMRKLWRISECPAPGGGTIGIAEDITAVEELQEELQRYVSAQDDLLESATSAMAIYGPEMRLKSYNAAFVGLWKLDEAWLDNEPAYGEVLEALREKRCLPEQADFRSFKQQQVKLFTDLIGPHQEFFYLPDGRTLRVLVIPHALGGLLFTYEDVTDRLALERSYNTLIAVQKQTINRLQEGVAVFGEDGRLQLSNPEFARLWKQEEAFLTTAPHLSEILERTRSLYQYAEWEPFKQELLAVRESRSASHRRLERSDGTVLDWGIVPLPDGATLFTFADVTDSTLVERSLREKNEALEAADRVKTEFLANVSYELRSPLTSISGFVDMLRENYLGPLTDKQREYLDAIHQSGEDLAHLIGNVLDLASIEAGYLKLEVAEVAVKPLLVSVLGLVKQRAREQGALLTLDCPATIGHVLADEPRLKQALFNLLTNAMKYTPKQGKIILGGAARRGENGQEEVHLWVEDTGTGIAPEEQQAVFSAFYRGTALAPPKAGAGLGLPMVKNITELHGGRVELTSTPGAGTKVTCILPRENPNLEIYRQLR